MRHDITFDAIATISADDSQPTAMFRTVRRTTDGPINITPRRVERPRLDAPRANALDALSERLAMMKSRMYQRTMRG